MDLQSVILGLLQHEPMSGYELKQVFDTTLSYMSGASFGSIYPTLRKLKQKGLASVQVQEQEGRPAKKVYTITEAGRRAFIDAVAGELQVPPYRNELLMRLFFFSFIPPERQREIVQEYHRYLEEKQMGLMMLEPLVGELADPYQRMSYNFGLRIIKQYIRATRKLMEELQECQEERDRDGGAECGD